MLAVSVEVWKKHSLYWFIEDQTYAKRFSNEFGPQGIIIDCSSIKFKHYLQARTTSGSKMLILYAKQPIGKHRAPTPDEKSHWVKRITPICISLLGKEGVKATNALHRNTYQLLNDKHGFHPSNSRIIMTIALYQSVPAQTPQLNACCLHILIALIISKWDTPSKSIELLKYYLNSYLMGYPVT